MALRLRHAKGQANPARSAAAARQVGGGWRRFLDDLDRPRDRHRGTVPARVRRSTEFPTPAGRRPAPGGMRRDGRRACRRRGRGNGAGKRRSAVRAGVRACHPRAAGDGCGVRLRGMADQAEAIR